MKKKNWLLVAILGIVVFALGMLANSIMQRRAESQHLSTANINLKPFESRSEIWEEFYRSEYQSWK